MWYWEYVIKVYDDCDHEVVFRSGILAANTFIEAMEGLEEYYGQDNIMDVLTFKCITDMVFEFDSVNDDSDFDFVISKKGTCK